ncbi:hypothetical protein EON83_02130 [bacterium]|nr:MAG: hypothetical protein EON83_02130 [bacterium]
MNPILDREPLASLRDPAAIFHEGLYYCFHTAVETMPDNFALYVDVSHSRDLVNWSSPTRLTERGLNFSSPGNIIRFNGRWVMCLQSYPTIPGHPYGSDESRLWLMESHDLLHWSEPRLLQPAGCQANWCNSRRQIDPYLVEHDGNFYCFYKSEGKLGLFVSPDLTNWSEASPDAPVLCPQQTPDGSTTENPCVIHDGTEFMLFFSPCRKGRGVGVARSTDLIHWRDVRYLDFPHLSWAPGGPTAAMVLDTRPQLGHWTMFFHGDRSGPHGAAIGIARSDDLYNWQCD